MKVGLFDDEGKCIGIYSGDQDLSVVEHAIAVEVDEGVRPNTCEYDKAEKKVKHKEHVIPPKPPRTTPSIPERIAALEDEIKKLKEKDK